MASTRDVCLGLPAAFPSAAGTVPPYGHVPLHAGLGAGAQPLLRLSRRSNPYRKAPALSRPARTARGHGQCCPVRSTAGPQALPLPLLWRRTHATPRPHRQTLPGRCSRLRRLNRSEPPSPLLSSRPRASRGSRASTAVAQNASAAIRSYPAAQPAALCSPPHHSAHPSTLSRRPLYSLQAGRP
jgi:hypothetical protein